MVSVIVNSIEEVFLLSNFNEYSIVVSTSLTSKSLPLGITHTK